MLPVKKELATRAVQKPQMLQQIVSILDVCVTEKWDESVNLNK
jgi:hypothetical protein